MRIELRRTCKQISLIQEENTLYIVVSTRHSRRQLPVLFYCFLIGNLVKEILPYVYSREQ